MSPLIAAGGQLIVTSYDQRFCGRVARLPITQGVAHLEVHPATRQQPVIRTTLPRPEIEKRKVRFDADPNAEEPARDFVECCRVFFESKLADMFDDPAHVSWAINHPNPTLADFVQRLRPLVKAGPQGMFSGHVFRRFVDHPALADNSAVTALMNKVHHGGRQEIRPADVGQCSEQLVEMLEIVEQMSEEAYRWRRRDVGFGSKSVSPPAPLVPMQPPALDVLIYPDLAAFTDEAPMGETQESPERLDLHLLDDTVAYYLRRPNFGFAAPIGALALVETTPAPAADRRLVIARHGDAVYARRLLRGIDASVIGLTAEVPDPRTRTPKTIFVAESEVAIHQVVGILFGYTPTVPPGRDEAVLVDASALLVRVEAGFRVKDESAVPLALEKQIVLGGRRIAVSELGSHEGELAALTLDDGASIFKRIGPPLPTSLGELRHFESVGGLGSSLVLALGKPVSGLRNVVGARLIIGVLYHG